MIPRAIETERLVLSPLKISDAEEMVAVLADVSLYEFIGGDAPGLDALTERYRRQTSGSNSPDELWFNWIIRPVADQHAVGFVQATVKGHSADVAWLVGVSHQGRGIAAEAALAVRDWLVSNDVRQIEAHVHPSHAASKGVARRIGLSPTASLDEDGEEIWASG